MDSRFGAVTGIEPELSAWELYGAARLPPDDSATCGDIAGLTVSDRDYPQRLPLSGTQRARPFSATRVIRIPTSWVRLPLPCQSVGFPALAVVYRCDLGHTPVGAPQATLQCPALTPVVLSVLGPL